jgi:uncharacterized protein with HEPN domain
MARDLSAYLCDIFEACNAIEDVMKGVTLEDYRKKRAIRSSVERESAVDLPNLLTHNYGAINDNAVYGLIYSDLIFLTLHTLRPGNRERSCLSLRLALRLNKETAAGIVLTHPCQ